MKNFTIRIKLIIIFILIKIIPLLIISYIAYEGVLKLDNYIKSNTTFVFEKSKETILKTADEAINDSVENLDKKSQLSLERLSYEIANNIAQFLYERDADILFLSKLDINQKLFKEFFDSRNRDVLVHDKYFYNDKGNKWEKEKKEITDSTLYKNQKADVKDNEREFNITNLIKHKTISIPIYKEISYFDLNGKEIYKYSTIDNTLKDISKKSNTYINSETYFKELSSLNKNDIYVSHVIGEYIPSKIIGNFTKEKAKKANIEFDPEMHAYAGKENPVGKKFEGIIRFITPIFKKNKKIAYLSLALDHEHIMQFTDTVNPTGTQPKQAISDASQGNYAFMWDHLGRNISHPRDYFIVGFDKQTGEYETPWLSLDIAKKYEKSDKSITKFLEEYPTFEEQSLLKKPNIKQLKGEGNIALDCRYLNFAPQCQGWMQLTEDGGYGSFIIFWSNVWKLTTAATIPYYTGQYKNSARGFGFVTIGANVDEFHSAANKTKENVAKILKTQVSYINKVVGETEIEVNSFISKLINELTIVTVIMVILVILIALWLSNYISKKIEKILIGTNKFANNELDYRIEVTSDDEIGKLERSFNNMASEISYLIENEKKINESLEQKIAQRIEKQREQEQILIQQSKLASMGEMIGNIAHQWRQPLNALSLVIQNIQIMYEVDELDDEYVEKSVKKANSLTSSMSKTIDDFRNFFSPNKLKKTFKLLEIVENTINIMDSTLKHSNIEIQMNIEDKELSILGYPSEFSQVLLNILNNAKDALIKTKIVNPKIIIHIYLENSFVITEISDNASGIPENIIDKVFEPYFTTKHQGQGTGIGLYMSKVIIENNMHGVLSAHNSETGAVFKIKIPETKN